MSGPSTPPREAAFRRVLRGMLRPLVKAMIAHGMTIPSVYRLLKEVFVDVAVTDFLIDNKPPTDSRVSVLTGIYRKDVKTIRAAGPDRHSEADQRVSAITSLVGRWLGDPTTTDDTGAPLPLPRQSEDGPSFDRIARSVSTDIRPRTLLDELMRQGLVTECDTTGRLCLEAAAVVGPAEPEQKVHFFSQNVGDHIAAATENLLVKDGKSPFLERAVYYNCLTAESVDNIESEARRLSTELLSEINRKGFAHQQADTDHPEAVERFRLGVFFYRSQPSSDTNGETAEGSAAENRPTEGKSR